MTKMLILRVNHPHPIRIQFQQDKQQDSKAPQRRPAITNKRQWYPDNRHQPNGHTDIDHYVKENNRGYPISVYAREWRPLPFGYH